MKLRILVLGLTCILPMIFADTNATLAGRVTDPNGAMIAKAKVAVTNSDTGLKRSTESNAEGLYVLDNLPPGKYQVQVEAQGFETLVHDGVILRVQDIVTQNYSMKLGAVANSVTVEDGASMVQADSGAVGTVIDRRFVENMPLNGRSFQSLIFLAPGVVLTSTSAIAQGQFSVNGQRANTNYVTVDGVSANFAASNSSSLGAGLNGSLPAFNGAGATNGLVSVDALQEFRIQTSSYSAEYGRSPGAQIALVTRSGTNHFHGSAFDYFRNDIFDANNWFANANRTAHPPLRQHDTGAVLGGPVLLPKYNGRDRTFFFASFEDLQLRQPQTAVTTVPSIALRNTLQPTFLALLNAFPIPTGADAGNGSAVFAASYSVPTTMAAGSLRIDQVLPHNSLLFVRYNQSPQEFGSRAPSDPSNLTTTDDSTKTFTIGLSNVFRPTITNDLRLNYSRESFISTSEIDGLGGAVSPTPSLLFPSYTGPQESKAGLSLSLPGIASIYSIGRGQFNVTRQFNLVETASWAHGKHLFKAGIDYRRLITPSDPPHALFSFSVNSLTALQAQSVTSGTITTGTEVRPIFSNVSAFAGDTWRVTRRFTLTYGLRWEFNPPPAEQSGISPLMLADVNNLLTSAVPPAGTPIYKTRYLNFAPRLGLAYQLRTGTGHETVIRGGSGIFYDLGTSGAAYGFQGYPFALQKPITAGPFPLSAAALSLPVAVTAPPYPGTSYTYDPAAELPYTIQWNVAIEQALGRSQTVTLTYTGALGRRLPFFAAYLAILGGPKNPNFTTGIDVTRNILTSDYHGLQVQYQRRLARGLQGFAAYTWSHAIDEQSDEATTTIRRGDSTLDRRHSFKTAISYDIPGVTRQGVISAITSHWSIDTMVYAVSAPPINVLTSTVFGPDGEPIYQSLNLVAGVPIYLSDPNVPGGKKLNGAAFSNPPAGIVGTLGRNALRGLPLAQADLSLRREFRLREGLRLQARVDSFNFLNHPNFGPYASAGSRTAPTFGQATSMYGASLGSAGGLGGFNPLYQIGGPRTNQLSLKLIF